MKKTHYGSTAPKTGWTPSFPVCLPEEGWSRKFIGDDPTLTTVAICKTRDADGHWATFYRQTVSKKALKKMRVKLQRVIDKARREELRTFGKRLYF